METHEMRLHPEPFEGIKNGSKVVEIRLNDEKRRLMKIGDKIRFSLRPDLTENIHAEIIGLDVFKTFKESYAAYFEDQQKQEQWKEIYKYYSPKEEEKYGVLGIRIKLESKSLELARQFLGREVQITIDRPMHSKHPKHGFEYEVNYGYIEGIKAPDGEDLDAYYLGVDVPLQKAKGICIAIIHRKNDDDDKLVVAPKEITLSDEEILTATHFQEQWFDSEVVRE